MKRFRWQLIIIFLTALVVGIFLVTEGKNGLLQPSGLKPATGGAYNEALVGEVSRLNPLLEWANPIDQQIDRLIYSRLFTFDAQGVPQTDLVAAWGVSEDGLLYNIQLREGIKWHDGEALTTDDVMFTLDMIRNGGEYVPADLQKFWTDIPVVKLDDLNMQFQLPEAYAPFLDYLNFGILPEHLLGGLTVEEMVADTFNLQPVGSGPFRFDSATLDNGVVIEIKLKANKDYYRSEPFLQEIVFHLFEDPVSALQAYEDGYVQGIGEVSADIFPDVLNNPDLEMYSGRQPFLSMILFNLKNPETPFFQEKNVRQALLMGINRQNLLNTLYGGQAIVAESVILPGNWAYFKGVKNTAYDPDRANQLLKNAGYPVTGEEEPVRKKGDQEFAFTLLYPDDDAHRALAEAIQSYWTKLNIKVSLEPLPYADLIETRLAEHNYEAALVDLNFSRYPDPDPYPFWDQSQVTSGQNYSQWENQSASEYLEEARVITDLSKRKELYQKFQYIFQQEMPALPLFYPVYTFAVDQQIQGIRLGPIIEPGDRFENVFEWYVVAKKAEAEETEATAAP